MESTGAGNLLALGSQASSHRGRCFEHSLEHLVRLLNTLLFVFFGVGHASTFAQGASELQDLLA